MRPTPSSSSSYGESSGSGDDGSSSSWSSEEGDEGPGHQPGSPARQGRGVGGQAGDSVPSRLNRLHLKAGTESSTDTDTSSVDSREGRQPFEVRGWRGAA